MISRANLAQVLEYRHGTAAALAQHARDDRHLARAGTELALLNLYRHRGS